MGYAITLAYLVLGMLGGSIIMALDFDRQLLNSSTSDINLAFNVPGKGVNPNAFLMFFE